MTEAERIEALFPGKPLLTPEEAARCLDFSRKRVYALTAAGFFRPPVVEKAGALIFFRKALLVEFLERGSAEPPPAPKAPEPAPGAPAKRPRGRPRKSSLGALAAPAGALAVLAFCGPSEGRDEGAWWLRRGRVVGPVLGSEKALRRGLRSGLRIAPAPKRRALDFRWARGNPYAALAWACSLPFPKAPGDGPSPE